jgi:hypothetical protein
VGLLVFCQVLVWLITRLGGRHLVLVQGGLHYLALFAAGEEEWNMQSNGNGMSFPVFCIMNFF